jgi:hypothetical protein
MHGKERILQKVSLRRRPPEKARVAARMAIGVAKASAKVDTTVASVVKKVEGEEVVSRRATTARAIGETVRMGEETISSRRRQSSRSSARRRRNPQQALILTSMMPFQFRSLATIARTLSQYRGSLKESYATASLRT